MAQDDKEDRAGDSANQEVEKSFLQRHPGRAKIKVEVEFELDDERVFNLNDGGIKTTLVTEN